MRRFVIIKDSHKQNALAFIASLPLGGLYEVTVREADRRTLDQNAKLWPVLTDISEQVDWYGQKLTQWEWKDFLTASLKQQKVVPNMDGTGFIVLGASTSNMSKKVFSELIELSICFGTEKGVKWSDEAREAQGRI